MPARRFFSLAVRLAHYNGVFAAQVRANSEHAQPESQPAPDADRIVAFDGTHEALESNSYFAGLGTYSTAPALEEVT